MSGVRKSVSRILAVGGAPADAVRRLSRGANYACVYGSEREHEDLRAFCARVEALLRDMNLELSDLSPEDAAAGVTLGLGQIDDSDVAWVNGVEIGGMDVFGSVSLGSDDPLLAEGAVSVDVPGNGIIEPRSRKHVEIGIPDEQSAHAQRFEEDDPRRKDIAARIDLFAHHLFGRHVADLALSYQPTTFSPQNAASTSSSPSPSRSDE